MSRRAPSEWIRYQCVIPYLYYKHLNALQEAEHVLCFPKVYHSQSFSAANLYSCLGQATVVGRSSKKSMGRVCGPVVGRWPVHPWYGTSPLFVHILTLTCSNVHCKRSLASTLLYDMSTCLYSASQSYRPLYLVRSFCHTWRWYRLPKPRRRAYVTSSSPPWHKRPPSGRRYPTNSLKKQPSTTLLHW